MAAEIFEFHPFQIVPDAFGGIQLRGLSEQLLQMDTLCRSLGQELLDHFAATDPGPVPKDQQFARNVARQVPKKAHHIRPFVELSCTVM